jgi:hypothetical protein
MDAVLGLSMTPDGVGWVLLDDTDAAATVSDQDMADMASGFAPRPPDDDDLPDHAAMVRDALASAEANDRRVRAAQVTWSEDVSANVPALLKTLSDFDFDLVSSIRLKEAIRTWAVASGRALEFDKSAVCLFEATTVTILAIGYGVARTVAAMPLPEHANEFGTLLTDLFERNGLHCDGLFLLGAPEGFDEISTGLESALGIPIVTDDGALALARGAALATPPPPEIIDVFASQQTVTPSAGVFQQIKVVGAKALSAVSDRPQVWVPAALAVCAAAAVVATYAFPPKFTGETEPARTENRPASAVSAELSDSSAPVGPVTSADTPALPAPAGPPPLPAPKAVVPAVAPTQATPPPAPANRRAPQVSIAYEEPLPTAITASIAPQSTPAPTHDGNGPAADGAEPRWPFASPPTTGDPTTDPTDDGDDPGAGQGNSGGGQDNAGGGQNTPGGGQSTPSGGPNSGAGQGGTTHGQGGSGQNSPSGSPGGATT